MKRPHLLMGCAIALTALLFALSGIKMRILLVSACGSLFVLAFLYMCLLPDTLDCRLELPGCGTKQTDITGYLHVFQKGHLPLFCGRACGRVSNLLVGEMQQLELSVGLLGGEEGTAAFHIRPEVMGIYQVEIDKIELLGLFGLGRKTLHLSLKKECVVLPVTRELSYPITRSLQKQEDGEETIQSRWGYDASAYHGVHPFQEGDSLHHIHWKLTGKMEEYMVKELDMPAEKMCVLYLDTWLRAMTAKAVDSLMENYISLAQHLAEEGVRHFLCWKDQKEDEWRVHTVTSLTELDESFDLLLRCGFAEEPVRELPEEVYQDLPRCCTEGSAWIAVSSRDALREELPGRESGDHTWIINAEEMEENE